MYQVNELGFAVGGKARKTQKETSRMKWERRWLAAAAKIGRAFWPVGMDLMRQIHNEERLAIERIWARPDIEREKELTPDQIEEILSREFDVPDRHRTRKKLDSKVFVANGLDGHNPELDELREQMFGNSETAVE